MITRVLGPHDFDAVVDLNRSSKELMRDYKYPEYDFDFENSLRRGYLDPADSQRIMFGTFEGDHLEALVSIFDWKTLPYYTIINLKSRPRHPYSVEHPIFPAMNEMLTYAESAGLYRFYFLRAAKNWPRGKIAKRWHDMMPALKRYDRAIELYIPATVIPKYDYARSIMGGRRWMIDLVLETGSLKQEFRPTASLMEVS